MSTSAWNKVSFETMLLREFKQSRFPVAEQAELGEQPARVA